jgi:uncharacterized membrane protein
MKGNKFPISESVRYGWDVFKDNLGFFIGFLIIIFLVNFFFSFFANLFERKLPFFAFLFSLGSLLAGIVINIVAIKIALRFCDGKAKPKMRDISFSASTFYKFVLGYLLYSLIVIAGFLLLIIPGIIWSIKYLYIVYLIVDKDSGPLEAMKQSARITGGVKWELFAFMLLLMVVNMAGALFFIIGLFVTIPVTMVAMAYIYRKLSSGAVPSVPSELSPFQAPRSIG